MSAFVDKDDAIETVRQDIVTGFRDAFGGGEEAFSAVDQFHGLDDPTVTAIGNERCAVVIWEYQGVHSSEFQGIEATNAPVTIEGCSVVSLDDEGRRQQRRYVNWVGLLGQMGVTFTRPIQYEGS